MRHSHPDDLPAVLVNYKEFKANMLSAPFVYLIGNPACYPDLLSYLEGINEFELLLGPDSVTLREGKIIPQHDVYIIGKEGRGDNSTTEG